MYSILADVSLILSFAIAPGLLLIRFFRPRLLPRLALLILAAVLGGTAFYFVEFLRRSDWLQRLGPISFPQPAEMAGMVVLQGPGRSEFILGAVMQLVYLLLWLVPYGVTQILLKRRNQASRVAA
jgi:hypothetical protein